VRRLLAAAAAASVVAGCGVSGTSVDEPSIARERGWLVPGSAWQLVTLNGAPYAGALTAELTTDGRVVGQGPCNRFSAPYSGRWPDLTFEPLLETRGTCPEIEAEASALAALARVENAAMEEGRLVLRGPDGVYLGFDPV
jgi:heat shock protein HslJ